ncbi:MAG: arginine--tRNA ligase, partial [Actinobacteria bacterium]|nr:arginine--tRNA ligase [Actinomycetota bacterium]
MTPAELSAAIIKSIAAVQANGQLAAGELPTEVVVERPKNRQHGDWSTNVAMQLAPKFDLSPRAFAELITGELKKISGVEGVEIAGPGFINLSVSAASVGSIAKVIVETGNSYGHGNDLAGVKLNLEFVSANPTGPIHMGGTRWAAVGDSLARIFEAQGAAVTREYYF